MVRPGDFTVANSKMLLRFGVILENNMGHLSRQICNDAALQFDGVEFFLKAK